MNFCRSILAGALCVCGLCHAADDGEVIAPPPPPESAPPEMPSAPLAPPSAEESGPSGFSRRSSDRSSRRGGATSGAADFREITASLKEKYPEEFAEIESLRQSDPRQSMEKFRALMDKAGISMPTRGGFQGNATGAAALPVVAVDRNFRRRRMKLVNAELLRRYPEEFQHLQTLYAEDPEGARYFFIDLARRLPKVTAPLPAQEAAPAFSASSASNADSVNGDRQTQMNDVPPGPPPGGAPGQEDAEPYVPGWQSEFNDL